MNKIKNYLIATRPFSFTVSLVPPFLALAIASFEHKIYNFNILNFILLVLGGFLSHAGSNVLSDYFDYKNKIDRDGTYGSSGVLVGKIMSLREVFNLAIFCFIIAFLIGIYFIFSLKNGFSLIWLIAFGGFLGFFYTTPPFNIKYKALGDIAVFLAFGPLMTFGGYFVLTGMYSLNSFLYSFPIGFIVIDVLHANNIRDIKNDKEVNIKTLPILLGVDKSKIVYKYLIYGAYFSIPIFILFLNLTYWSLLAFITFPLAKKNIDLMMNFKDEKEIIFLDALTAKFHTVFSLVFILSFFMSKTLNKIF